MIFYVGNDNRFAYGCSKGALPADVAAKGLKIVDYGKPPTGVRAVSGTKSLSQSKI